MKLHGSGDIAGYRAFLAIVAVTYFTLLVVSAAPMGPKPIPVWRLTGLGVLYLALGIWGFDYAQRLRNTGVSLAYLLLEFWIGMSINDLAHGAMLPLILLPLAAQAVSLLPRPAAVGMCALVIWGVSGNLTWIPTWPDWFRNLSTATAAVVFVVVYVGVASREREARQRVEALSAEVAQLAAAEERNRLAREIHDTLGHYLTVIHVQLEAARAVVRTDPDKGLHAIGRAQMLAKDGLAAVRQSVTAIRENTLVDGIDAQLAALVAAARDETLSPELSVIGTPRALPAATALALHRTALEALTNVRRHAAATSVTLVLTFHTNHRVGLQVRDNGQGARETTGGFGLTGIRERAMRLSGRVDIQTAPGAGFVLDMEVAG